MSYIKRYLHIAFLFILILLLNYSASAEQITADEIMDRVKDKQIEYENSKTQAEMIIIDKNGKTEEREMLMYQKEEDDKISILMRFLSAMPPDMSKSGKTILKIRKQYRRQLSRMHLFSGIIPDLKSALIQNHMSGMISSMNCTKRDQFTELKFLMVSGFIRKHLTGVSTITLQ